MTAETFIATVIGKILGTVLAWLFVAWGFDRWLRWRHNMTLGEYLATLFDILAGE